MKTWSIITIVASLVCLTPGLVQSAGPDSMDFDKLFEAPKPDCSKLVEAIRGEFKRINAGRGKLTKKNKWAGGEGLSGEADAYLEKGTIVTIREELGADFFGTRFDIYYHAGKPFFIFSERSLDRYERKKTGASGSETGDWTSEVEITSTEIQQLRFYLGRNTVCEVLEKKVVVPPGKKDLDVLSKAKNKKVKSAAGNPRVLERLKKLSDLYLEYFAKKDPSYDPILNLQFEVTQELEKI